MSVGLFLVGTNAFVIAGVLPEVAHTFDVETSQAGYAVTWYAAVVATVAPAIGFFLSGVPRAVLVGTGMGLIATGTLVTVVAPTLTTFVLGRVLAALGGAAFVPTVFATVPGMVPPHLRGRALAVLEVGFGVSVAVGAPLGTAVAHVTGWRAALLAIVLAAGVLTVAMGVWMRDLPGSGRLTWASSASVLVTPRLLLLIASNLGAMVAFNVVYVFSSVVASGVTAGDGSRLTLLLAVCGAGGLVGTAVSGPLSDAWGSTVAGMGALVLLALSLLGLTLQASSAVVLVCFFGVGAASQAFVVPQQHRLFEVRPHLALVSSSWNSTAMYGGIALAPVLGGLVIHEGGTALAGLGAATAAALVIFTLGARRSDEPTAAETA
jgi:DHA1 family purine base/nucleoside efflux pump-like MFS transporter